MQAKRTRLVVALLTGFVFVVTAHAQPRRRAKPASKADIERLEKRIEDQQRQIDKLLKLQQAYLASLTAILEGKDPPPAPVPDKPAPTPPPKPATSDAKPLPTKYEARPAVARINTGSKHGDQMETKPKGGTIVGKVAGASDAIVYIDTIVHPVRGTATMKQEGKQFVPRVLVVTKGTTVDFPNRDAIFHNVFSVTPDHSFDLGSYRQGETKSVTMSKPGVVTVYCNMHPQMVGNILVTPNPNYVRAGKDGFFRLNNVPAGNHRVVAWAPNAKPTVVQANVVDGEVITVEMAVKKGRARTHTKKDGMPYGSYDK